MDRVIRLVNHLFYGIIISSNKNDVLARPTHCLERGSYVYKWFLRYLSVRKYDRIKILSNFENFRCQNNEHLKNGWFSAKVEKGGLYHVIQTGY